MLFRSQMGATASAVLLVQGHSTQTTFSGLAQALQQPDTALRLFGKPAVEGERRMGVAMAQAATVEVAREKALQVISRIKVEL